MRYFAMQRALRRMRIQLMPQLVCSPADLPERLQQRYRGVY